MLVNGGAVGDRLHASLVGGWGCEAAGNFKTASRDTKSESWKTRKEMLNIVSPRQTSIYVMCPSMQWCMNTTRFGTLKLETSRTLVPM